MTSAFDDMLGKTSQRLQQMGVSDTYATQSVSGEVDADFGTRSVSGGDMAPVSKPRHEAASSNLSGTVNGRPFSFRPGSKS